MMKKTFLCTLYIALVLAPLANAQTGFDTVQVDNIWYILDQANRTAKVTYGPASGEDGMWGGIGQNTYSGRLIIPESISQWDDQYGSVDYIVNSIGDQAFAWCPNLTGIVIPKTVLTVGSNLFQRTNGVTELKIADGEDAISFTEGGMDELGYTCTYLYLGRNVADNGGVPVFHTWSTVQNVVIGENVTEIPLAFCPYARDLQSIQINTPNVLTRGIRMFGFIEEDTPQPDASLITLYVPEGMANEYNADAFWSRFTIQEMDITRRYGIRFVTGIFDFSYGGLYYRINNPDTPSLGVTVVIPQVWYINPDGTYVSTWSSEFPYKQSHITIPDSVSNGTHTYPVVSIGEYCFREASNLQSLTIPSTVTYIGAEAFEYTMKLKSLTIPESVTTVGWLTFARSGLEEVLIPASSSNWGFGDGLASFQECPNLVKATFASGNTRVQDRIFFGCSALRTIIIPDEVTEIGAGAFAGCEALTELKLPASLYRMNDRMLRGCPIRSLEIPAGVREIDSECLLATNISKLSVHPANPMFDSRDNCNAIIRTADNTLICACNGTFIPQSVDSIGEYAFNELDGIRSITLPANLKKIGAGGMMNLNNLTLITSHIQNPANVLDETAFESWWNDPKEQATLYVPAGTLAAYRADSVWNLFQHIVELAPENKPAEVEDLQPVSEEGDINFTSIAAQQDLSNAVVDNLYLTCDTLNGDGFDAQEQAIVFNSVVDSVMMDNIMANQGNMDIIRNNFSGCIIEIPAGSGVITIEGKVTGDRNIVVHIAGLDPQYFSPNSRQELVIPYSTAMSALVYIYGIVAEQADLSLAPSKHRVRKAKAENGEPTSGNIAIYGVSWNVQTDLTAFEQVSQDADKMSRKVLVNGQVLILRNGKTYNALGAEIK